jgi:acyl-[acyl-carrier-protein]-phospholipid O-acyltransferase/long-chain-fatty-acid--[acyl-carrier-protein] ligase
VTGVPDELRGERLVAFYVDAGLQPPELWRRLSHAGLPPLWLPKAENLHPVESLPLLATGKLDLRAVKAKAMQLEAAQEIQ